MKKTRLEFSIPMTKAVIETTAMKGYMICASQVHRTLADSSHPGFNRRMIHGASATPATATMLMKHKDSVSILRPKIHAASSFSVFILRENVVTKAVDSAPSANKSRSMFGVANARLKMPVKADPKSPLSN